VSLGKGIIGEALYLPPYFIDNGPGVVFCMAIREEFVLNIVELTT
jgi:hypothetical protein